MRRWRGWIAIGWMAALTIAALAAYGRPHGPATIDDRTRAIAAQLRCPVCHGESVADSPSDIARSIRALIRKRLVQGESAAAIRRYLQSRYGDTILLAPPASGVGSLAWLGPPVVILGSLCLLVLLILDWRRQAELPAADASRYLERARAELVDARME